MKAKLIALSLCTLALAACDFEQRPDSAADRGGTGTEMTRPGSPGGPGATPSRPMSPPANEGGPATPPAGSGTGQPAN
ncbi:MAG: hypothetical protein AB7G13_25630 [Lautropia sp.]